MRLAALPGGWGLRHVWGRAGKTGLSGYAGRLPRSLPMPLLALLVLALVEPLWAQVCTRPVVGGSGHPVRIEPTQSIAYSDGYLADGNLLLPDVAPPACGWPLVVYVHRLGANRLEEPALRQLIAERGYAVWSYDVRGQASGLYVHSSNLVHPNRGSSFWGPAERFDLAEQIQHVANQPAWQGLVDASRVAVMGPSQGAAHAWAAAALSGQTLSVAGRGVITMPVIRCVVPTSYVADAVSGWLKEDHLWSMWFVNNIADDVSHLGYEFDQGLWNLAASAFRNQDSGPLLSAWAAEDRSLAADLQKSTVPILYSQAYHDLIDTPMSSLQILQSRSAPVRVLLSTLGHNTPRNDAELGYRDQVILRWLHRWLWDEYNAVELERPYVLSELPLASAERNSTTHLWSRQHGENPLSPGVTTRFYLYDDGSLQEVEPTGSMPSALIDHQIIDPAFTPASFLADVANRTTPGVLGASPLSQHEYATAPFTEETSVVAAPTVRLQVVPQHEDWMVAALLSVQLPSGAPYQGERVMLSSWGERRQNSVPGTSEALEFQLSPVAVRVPPGAQLVLTLRNHWLRESPMMRVLEVAPLFAPFQVAIEHGDASSGSWIDLPLAEPTPALVCEQPYLDLQTMAPLPLTLRGGLARAGKPYFVSMSASGQVPGMSYFGETLPINQDWLTVFVAGAFTQPQLAGFIGTLDSQNAESLATLNLSHIAPLDPILTDLRITFAGFVWDGFSSHAGSPSNPVDVILR